jgi:hypothetical protein
MLARMRNQRTSSWENSNVDTTTGVELPSLRNGFRHAYTKRGARAPSCMAFAASLGIGPQYKKAENFGIVGGGEV